MTIVEIGCMGAKPGLRVMDESTPEGKVLPNAYNSAIVLPGGPQNAFWGLEAENPLKLWAFFEWSSIEEHELFANRYGANIVKDLPTILTHGEFTRHIDVTPAPSRALTSTITDVTLAYFSADISQDAKTKISTQFQQLLANNLGKCGNVTGYGCGWGIENDFPVRGLEDDLKGSPFITFVGWDSREAREKYKDSDKFSTITKQEGVQHTVTFSIECRSSERVV